MGRDSRNAKRVGMDDLARDGIAAPELQEPRLRLVRDATGRIEAPGEQTVGDFRIRVETQQSLVRF